MSVGNPVSNIVIPLISMYIVIPSLYDDNIISDIAIFNLKYDNIRRYHIVISSRKYSNISTIISNLMYSNINDQYVYCLTYGNIIYLPQLNFGDPTKLDSC